MQQYVKFVTIDPDGFMLVRLEDIKAIQTESHAVCRLTTPHDQVLVKGTMEYFLETMRTFVGSEWDAADWGASEAQSD